MLSDFFPRYATRYTLLFAPVVWLRGHVAALSSLLIIALLYVAALVAMPPEGLTHHDTGAKYLQVRNLRLSTSGLDWSINYPARSLDPDMEFVPFNAKQRTIEQGRIHLQWPIFLGLLTRVPWKVMGFWGLYVVPLLSGVGVAWATYLLAIGVGVPRRVAWIAVPLVGLATPVFIYSLLFFEHTLAALLVTLSLVAACRAIESPGSQTMMLSGALLAVAIYFRSELYVLALVVGGVQAVLALRDEAWRERLIKWAVAFGLALIPLWAFYALTEGTLVPLHATWYFAGGEGSTGGGIGNGTSQLSLPPLRYIATAGWGVVPDALLGPQGFALSPRFPWWVTVAGLLGTGLVAAAALMRLLRDRTRLRELRLWTLVAGLGLIGAACGQTLFSGQDYSNLHGFLIAAPFVALALWPTEQEGAQERWVTGISWLYIVTLLYVGLHLLVISAFSGLGPVSRHEWGQRYLLPAYPALVVLALHAAWRIWSVYAVDARLRKVALAGLVAWGVLAAIGLGFNLRGYVVLAEQRREVTEWMALARTMPGGEPLLTDVWWLPLNLAADFYSRPIMLAEGTSRIEKWAEQMKEKGVTSFGFMSTTPAVFEGAWRTGVEGLSVEGPEQEADGVWLQRYRFNSIP